MDNRSSPCWLLGAAGAMELSSVQVVLDRPRIVVSILMSPQDIIKACIAYLRGISFPIKRAADAGLVAG